MEKLKIFISGTQDDMKPERDAVDRAVNSTMLSTGIRAETAVSQLKPPRAWIEQQIRECNIYIGVYSHRYGWVIPGEDVSATEFEYNLARKLGKPILVWIRKLRDEEKTKPDFDRQEQFLNRVSDFSTGHLRQEFDNPADLEKWVTSALSETFTEIIRRGTAPTASKFLVPFPHNPDFVGRDVELSSLHEMLQQGQSIVGIRPTVLVGLGGIGKTQLAEEYAHAHRDNYPSGVFWLNAINPLLSEFSDLAENLEMADRNTPRDIAARRAWDYLDSHSDALVIFDNIIEPSELNRPFSPDLVPGNLRCHILITTRQRDLPLGFQPFEVKVLPEMAAMRLLLRSRPEVLEEQHPEWSSAQIVCASLGWLPLALKLAASYLDTHPEVSIKDYLERIRNEGGLKTVDESEMRAVDLANAGKTAELAVNTTLQTQWKRLDDDDARLLFRALGQFPEASWIPISRLGLLTGIESETKLGRPSPLTVALKKLYGVSLIGELSEDRLRLHPLVQEFAARLASASFRLEMAKQVATEFNDPLRMQARIIRYGIDMTLEDIRTALGFCIDRPETETYTRIFNLERMLDSQAHILRNWNVQEQPTFFLQHIIQIRNESFVQGLERWQAQAEAELARLKQPYLFERFPVRYDAAELNAIKGHSRDVNGVVLSADGQLAISVSEDKTLKVWDIAMGRELLTFIGHSGKVNSVALSADARQAISTSLDRTLKVWDISTTLNAHGPIGRERRTLTGHNDRVNGVALSANGQLAVSASDDKTLKVWDVATGRELRTLTGHSDRVNGVALSANGRLAASASADKTLKVWDVATGRELCPLAGHSSEVNGVALSADGRVVVSASDDQTIKVWNIATGHCIATLIVGFSLKCCSISADGKTIVAGDVLGGVHFLELVGAVEITVQGKE
jgi:hypothetical protein